MVRLRGHGLYSKLEAGSLAQGSILGSVHFNTVINNLGETMKCTLLKCAGNIKLGQFSTLEGRAAIQ